MSAPTLADDDVMTQPIDMTTLLAEQDRTLE
jgi:hypothetical protein